MEFLISILDVWEEAPWSGTPANGAGEQFKEVSWSQERVFISSTWSWGVRQSSQWFYKGQSSCYFTQSFWQVSIFETHSANIHKHICSFTFQAVVPSFSSISRTKKYSEFSDCNQETIEDVSSFQGWKLSLCHTFHASANSVMFRWGCQYRCWAAPAQHPVPVGQRIYRELLVLHHIKVKTPLP